MDIERQYDNAMSRNNSMLTGEQLPNHAPADNPYYGGQGNQSQAHVGNGHTGYDYDYAEAPGNAGYNNSNDYQY